jgi:hypothetical protein
MVLELVPLEDESENDVSQQMARDETPAYGSSERRRKQRRITIDRREMVRFEANLDRRTSKDRRITRALWQGRDF